MSYYVPGSRIRFRDICADDADIVTRWRNTQQARDSFFSTEVVTPDTHRNFVKHRQPHDLVWLVVDRDESVVLHLHPAIGMTALTVDVNRFNAEYGRTFVDPFYQGKGYAKEIEYTLLSYAFEVLNLKSLWLDAFTNNTAIINLHYKTGWQDDGKHEHARGEVLRMVYQREWWATHRQAFATVCNVRLGDWQA